MRLVILQDWLRIGGTERQTLHLARHAAARGIEVTLILFRPGGDLAPALEGVPYAVRVLQKWDTRVCLYAPGLLEAIDDARPEVILCMGRTANCYAGFLQERRRRTAVVATIRTGKWLFPLHSAGLALARAVLVNSRWWARRLRERGVPAERVHVVRNAFLSGGLPHPGDSARQRLRDLAGIAAGTTVFLQVASFRRGKRQADLLSLFAEFRQRRGDQDWVLWLVGEGPERPRCERLARSLGLAERVRFWGFKRDPHEFYAAADVAVSASREDSLPNFLVEAQSLGRPLIAYDFRGVEETCEPGRSGLIVAMGDRDGFVGALCQLFDDPVGRREMGVRGEAVAARRFSPDRQAAAVIDFLRAL